jgi:hypothetical protein
MTKAQPAVTATPKKKSSSKKTVRWTEPRVAIVRAMQSLKATKATAACTAETIAKKAKVEEQAVKQYCYHEEQLQQHG